MKKFLPQSIKNPQGFTLIELMVVVSIIAILSIIGITVFSGVQKNARDSKRKADIISISKAWENHYDGTALATAVYPALLPGWFDSNSIPTDPRTSAIYAYDPAPAVPARATDTRAGSTYRVCAVLETAVVSPGYTTPSTNYCLSSQQ